MKKLVPKTKPYFDWLHTVGGVNVSLEATPPPPTTLDFTTTLDAITGHNISNASTYNKAHFSTLFTGTSHKFSAGSGSTITSFTVDSTKMDDSENAAAPVNVSKVNLHTLMPSGWAGKIICYLQAWWGTTSHPSIGYSDTDATTVAAIVKDCAARGYDVMCLDWYGQTISGAGNDTVQDLITANCAANGMTFAMMIDEQYLKDGGFTASTYQSGLVTALNHFNTKYYGNAAYEKVGGRPLVFLWDVAGTVGTNVNWTTLKTQINGNPLLIQYQAGGFTVTASDGAFSWVDTNAPFTSGVTDGTTYLTSSFLPACTAHQSLLCISSVVKGFNGTLTKSVSWSDGKFIDQQNGQTWLNWWQTNANYVNGGKRLDYIGVLTWDDFQEGSGVQTGILTNLGFTSKSISGTTLSWAVSGNENTVSAYQIYITEDGTNLALLATVSPTSAKSVDLSTLSIPAGTYQIYIRALGKPCIINQTSSAIPYTQH